MASKFVKCVVAALTGVGLIVLPTCAEAGSRTGTWRYVHPGYGYGDYYAGRPHRSHAWRGYARPYGGYAGGYYPGYYGSHRGYGDYGGPLYDTYPR